MGEGEAREFCLHGCYWECEHLVASGRVTPERAALRPVDDGIGHTLMRCRECGDYLYDVVGHAREHQRLRQLGLMPERPRW
ncbi:MAG: hypothetical protein FJZ92_07310 [Chloroflexi bacterium]|nr:hypothetical protein [Chloroflexota bacterium]